MSQKIKELLIRIKSEKPLILNINKYFSLDLIVSGLRSLGAMPITSNAEQEVEELLKLSRAVVINLGELDDDFIKLSSRICRLANELKQPIILDPIGAGATQYRTETAIHFIKEHQISVVRGYPSEIASMLNADLIRSEDGATVNRLAIDNATLLSKQYHMAVVVSGKINTVIDGDQMDSYNFDSELLLKVAGIGSLLSSLIGAFHAVEQDRFTAAATALGNYAVCVATAKNKADGPGSFKSILIDELYLNSYRCIGG
ncbi:MAG: hydroxyethylthiazole kinase [Gammaproteobacteria bacterium]|nr:hydroxyethylthiazole kinase [Gammaproteobacteria bacterium]